MKAFASDLDRTIIYSKRMIEKYGAKEEYELIEKINEKEISYISLKTKEMLKEINDHSFFIPVTTRTVEQYKRISLFNEEIVPKYAITSNGGIILKSGTILQDWSDLISEKLKGHTSLNEVINHLNTIRNGTWINRIIFRDNLFITVILDEINVKSSDLASVKHYAKAIQYQVSLQGRKLYLIPNPINKWNAVQYLCDNLNIKKVYGAGDSLLDYELIANSHYGISPLHGEVVNEFPTINKTRTVGISASTCIVENFLQFAQ